MTQMHIIAVDLGASSGRVMQVAFDGEQLTLREAHRFANDPVFANGTLHWDALRLWHEIQHGIKQVDAGAAGIGVDTWGVDFALLDRDGMLLGNPIAYRDAHKAGSMAWTFARVPRRTVFERTGLQFMEINGLYQLATLIRDGSTLLDRAHTFLTIADLFNYWLSGAKTCEFTQATTQQMYNPRLGAWDFETLGAIGAPLHIFPAVVPPGTRLGAFDGIPVYATACHDTGSAVVGVPTTDEHYAYLSSGTWSLIGLEVPDAIITDVVYEANLTNEGGAYGTYRLLKNVCGMWLVQQSRATWADAGQAYGYDQLVREAMGAEAFRSLIDPDDASFMQPGDIPARIREFCARTRQPIPETVGQVTRTIYESLALKYRHTLNDLIAVSGRRVDRLHIVGGGSQNALLNQMTADAIGRVVVAGPGEATAIGNALVQLIALGELGSVAQAREMLARSGSTTTYEPCDTAAWDDAYARFVPLLATP